MAKLTNQQKDFVVAYIKHLLEGSDTPEKDAAKTAGYKSPSVTGHKLKTKPQVKQAITRRINNLRQKNPELFDDGSDDMLEQLYKKALQQLKHILSRNILQYTDDNGYLNLSNMSGWTEAMGDVVESVKVIQGVDHNGEERVQTEIKWASKLPAIKHVIDLWGRMNESEGTNEKTQVVDWDSHLVKTEDQRRIEMEEDPLERLIEGE